MDANVISLPPENYLNVFLFVKFIRRNSQLLNMFNKTYNTPNVMAMTSEAMCTLVNFGVNVHVSKR